MKKENGFTLVELLTVIVILAIILIIAVPGVLSIINKTKNSAYNRQVDMIKEATRNYITANSITWNGDNPKSTLVTLDMLQSGGYLEKKLLDPRNKKEILCANVLVTKDNKNKISYDIDMECNEVQPISPRIGSGMIPIVYQENKWVKADSSNKDFAWFNYGNQQWANVATVTEDVRQTLLDAPTGTEVPMDKINTMFTWIPRFKYKLFNVDGTVSPVGNKNLAGDYMIDVKFETARTTKSTGTRNGEWLTHPAFTFGTEELEGFWMAKFETGYKDANDSATGLVNSVDTTKIVIKPSMYSWRGISLVNVYHIGRAMMNDHSTFGLSKQDNTHVSKNIEWGAMAYLTNSIYGKTGNLNYEGKNKKLNLNNNNRYITGCGASSNSILETESCNSYETAQGQAASTTGNITGVYDTAGGAWEYVMAGLYDPSGQNVIVSTSGFDQTELNTLASEGKYLDVYTYRNDEVDLSSTHLGDAIMEMGPFSVEGAHNINSWYSERTTFLTENNHHAWLMRSARFDFGKYSGITASMGWSSNGGAATYRLVIA